MLRRNKQIERQAGGDYATPRRREETVERLFRRAKDHRTAAEERWLRCSDYYGFLHDTAGQLQAGLEESGLPFQPPVVPDPFIMVESQIDPVLPEPEFRGRDGDQDGQTAKLREYAVRYVCQNNRLEDMITSNERRLIKLGDAFWKVYWDEEMPCGPHWGDIRVRDVPVEAVYVDPSAGAEGLQAAQYVDYVYRLNKAVFLRLYGAALEKLELSLSDLVTSAYTDRGSLFDAVSPDWVEEEDTVQVCEHWFRHPVPQDGAKAGEVGCSIQAGGRELKYIPRYWQRTGRQNRLFPFVHYWRIRDENQFYNRSELEPILPLVDAADRELANAILNDAFTANDIILMEENALADGEEFTNLPGAVVRTRANAIGKVARLGGLHSGANSLAMVEWLLGQIQRTNRNYETNQGKASSQIKTASELSMLRADADTQTAIKKADRNAGFVRLYELIDWSVLEFYDEARHIFLGAGQSGQGAVSFTLDTAALGQPRAALTDPLTGEALEEAGHYWPRVDVTVSAGDGILRSKAATLQALQSLAQVEVTADNYKLLSAVVELLDLPQKQELLTHWRARFGGGTEEERGALLARLAAQVTAGEKGGDGDGVSPL